jgi:protein TonB
MIVALDAGGTLGWLGADAMPRPAASRRGLHVSVSLEPPARRGRSEATGTTGTAVAAVPIPATLRGPKPERRAPARLADEPPRSARSSSGALAPEATSASLEPTPVAPASELGQALSDALPSATPGYASAGFSGEVSRDLGDGMPSGTGAAQHSGTEAEAGGSNARDYFSALHERVLAVREYPRRARREQIEGRVLLSIRIDRAGQVESCRVRESSGSGVLDRHAIRTIERAAPFGIVPASIDDRELDFDLPVEYELR